MTKEEAERVIRILLTADGGCQYCARDLLTSFCEEFPEFKELAEDIFKTIFTKIPDNIIKI